MKRCIISPQNTKPSFEIKTNLINTYTSKTELSWVIDLPLIIIYGFGTILGDGIYVLIGKVSMHGLLIPLVFVFFKPAECDQ